MTSPTNKRFILNTEHKEYEDYYDSDTGKPATVLGPLSSINIIVGANNAGKSRLIRKIFKSEKTDTLDEQYGTNLRKLSTMLCSLREQCGDAKVIHSFNKGETTRFPIDSLHTFCDRAATMSPNFWRALCSSLGKSSGFPEDSQRVMELFKLARHGATITADGKRPITVDGAALQTAIAELRSFTGDLKLSSDTRIYIPLHRTAITLFGENHEREPRDIFLLTLANNYGLHRSGNRDVFTGLDLYDRVMRARNGTPAERQLFNSFTRFLSETFFSGMALELVARYTQKPNEQHVYIAVGDGGNEREIHNLGDGISALIVLLYPIFMAPPGTWVMIEEPEISLHPGFQRIFLETLLTHRTVTDKNLRVFFTTHSNHLIGLAAEHPGDVSVINLSQRGDLLTQRREIFCVRHVRGASMHLLDELGVENGSVFLANCSIWVEGPSDRIIISAYLDAYFRHYGFHYMEDIDYAFFLYGGSLVEHYLFPGDDDSAPADSLARIRAQAISNRIFLLCDRDESPEKHRRHDEIKKFAGPHFGFRTTEPAVEIENTVSPEVLKKVLPQLHPRKTHGADLSKLNDAAKLEATRLGRLCSQVGIVFAHDPSGSLSSSDKTTYASLVKSLKPDWEMIGTNAQNLVSDLVEFIGRHSSARRQTPGAK